MVVLTARVSTGGSRISVRVIKTVGEESSTRYGRRTWDLCQIWSKISRTRPDLVEFSRSLTRYGPRTRWKRTRRISEWSDFIFPRGEIWLSTCFNQGFDHGEMPHTAAFHQNHPNPANRSGSSSWLGLYVIWTALHCQFFFL